MRSRLQEAAIEATILSLVSENTSICHGMNSRCFSACSTLVSLDWIQPCWVEVVRRFHLTGTSTGASLFFTKNTTNLAGFVVLALRPTT
jgi:hypothetical protein